LGLFAIIQRLGLFTLHF